jgi:hypothetical protein
MVKRDKGEEGGGDVGSHGTVIDARRPYWAIGSEDLILSIYRSIDLILDKKCLVSCLISFTYIYKVPAGVHGYSPHQEPRMPQAQVVVTFKRGTMAPSHHHTSQSAHHIRTIMELDHK